MGRNRWRVRARWRRLCDHDVGGDADVRLVEDVGGLEEGPVAVHRLQDRGRTDVVVRGEAQASRARDLRAGPAAAAEDPHLDVGALARHHVRLHAVVGAVGAGQQGEEVVDLFGVLLRLGAREQEQLALEGYAGRAQEAFEGEAGRYDEAVRGVARRRRLHGRLSRWASAGAAEAQVEAARVQGVDQAELLDGVQRGAVAELYGSGAEPDRGGRGGRQREHDRRGGARHPGVEVVLGEPVAGVAQLLGALGRWSCAGRRPPWSRWRSVPGRGRRGGCQAWTGSSRTGSHANGGSGMSRRSTGATLAWNSSNESRC